VKTYVAGGSYHIYNRGVEKRVIFEDDQDYRVFLHLLKYYLSPPDINDTHPLLEGTDVHLIRPRPLINVHIDVQLLAFCLLPNHFHLLVKQSSANGMTRLMQALSTTYVMYFNRRYDRVGPLFQDRYKAVFVGEGDMGDRYLLHLSRYIHMNPYKELTGPGLVSWPYSSLPYYLGRKRASWIRLSPVLDYFGGSTREQVAYYKRFVADAGSDPEPSIHHLVIE